MIFQAIKSAWPGPIDEGGADREWNCLLACGHEKKLIGRVGRSPMKGRAFAVCDQPLCGVDSDTHDCEHEQKSNPRPAVTSGDNKVGAERQGRLTTNQQVLTTADAPGSSPDGTAQAGAIPATGTKCPEGGEHEYTPDIEYDMTGDTINCCKCGESSI